MYEHAHCSYTETYITVVRWQADGEGVDGWRLSYRIVFEKISEWVNAQIARKPGRLMAKRPNNASRYSGRDSAHIQTICIVSFILIFLVLSISEKNIARV